MSSRSPLAWLWALIVLGCAAFVGQAWFSGRLAIDTDVLALLPHDSRNASAEAALARLSDGASRRVVVVLAAPDRASALAAAAPLQTLLANADGPLQTLPGSVSGLPELIDFYAPYRDRLLDHEQRARLKELSEAQIARAAVQSLYRPGPALRALSPLEDPTGSFSAWLSSRAALSKVRPDGDWLALQVVDHYLIVLPFELRAPALSVAALEQLQPLLDQAHQLAASHKVEMLSAGVAVHAAAAARQAAWEMSVIGLGAALGIAVLMLLSFGSPRAMLLVLGTVAIGLLVALSVCVLLFGRVHLLTLVFGASLVGVAEDYAIHYLSARALADQDDRNVLRPMLPALLLAFATSALGYLALAAAPFPGLKQMALFSIVGLLAALLSVLLWFPSLLGPHLPATNFSRSLARSRRFWPFVVVTPLTIPAIALLLAAAAIGLSRLTTSDDLRALQSSPPELIDQQTRIGRWLAEPSPVQFYLVSAANEESLLQREEALIERLHELQRTGFISGHRALSDWVPSLARQRSDATLLTGPSTTASAAIIEQIGASDQTSRPLTHESLSLHALLNQPLASALKPLFLGQLGDSQASVVQIAGLNDPAQLPRLQALAADLPGVQWVDKIADYSRLLREYRIAMSWVLASSFVLIYLLLLPRFRGGAWRVMAPALCALLVVLAYLGWRGEALQLFHVLGLTVMLGMSVDYGIFLMEPAPGDAPWLAVILGAVNTLLAFGLLAFSQTPALAAFGTTLLIGIGVAWLVAPMLCRAAAD